MRGLELPFDDSELTPADMTPTQTGWLTSPPTTAGSSGKMRRIVSASDSETTYETEDEQGRPLSVRRATTHTATVTVSTPSEKVVSVGSPPRQAAPRAAEAATAMAQAAPRAAEAVASTSDDQAPAMSAEARALIASTSQSTLERTRRDEEKMRV